MWEATFFVSVQNMENDGSAKSPCGTFITPLLTRVMAASLAWVSSLLFGRPTSSCAVEIAPLSPPETVTPAESPMQHHIACEAAPPINDNALGPDSGAWMLPETLSPFTTKKQSYWAPPVTEVTAAAALAVALAALLFICGQYVGSGSGVDGGVGGLGGGKDAAEGMSPVAAAAAASAAAAVVPETREALAATSAAASRREYVAKLWSAMW